MTENIENAWNTNIRNCNQYWVDFCFQSFFSIYEEHSKIKSFNFPLAYFISKYRPKLWIIATGMARLGEIGGSSPPHAPKHDPLDYQLGYYPSFYLTHTPPPPWEFLLISWDPTRWREVLVGVGGCCLNIQRDGENISWRGWGIDKSNWIPRDEEKWRETLTGLEKGRP